MFYSRKYIYRYLRTNNLRELVVGNFTISFPYSYHFHLQIEYNGHLIAERYNVNREAIEDIPELSMFNKLGHYSEATDIIADYLMFKHLHSDEKFVFKNGKLKTKWLKYITNQHYSGYPLGAIEVLNKHQHSVPVEHLSKFAFIINQNTLESVWFPKKYSYECIIDNRVKKIFSYFSLPSLGYFKYSNSWFNKYTTFDEDSCPETYIGENMVYCSHCNQIVHHLHTHKKGCSLCLKYDTTKAILHGYTEKATSHFEFKVGNRNNKLYTNDVFFGVEIEYETLDKEESIHYCAEKLSEIAIFKRDGSLNDGIEICTAPATPDVIIDSFEDFFDEFDESCLENRDTCGMHVHISKEPLSFLTQGKIVEFMNRSDNKEFIKAIAGRWSDRYAGIHSSRTITFPFKHGYSDRYNAVNLQNPSTLEFRVFSSPTTYEEFVTKIEFVVALLSYCSPCQAKAPNLKDITSWKYFAMYVEDHKSQFKYLYSKLPTFIELAEAA